MERGEQKAAGWPIDIERLDRMTTIVERVRTTFGDDSARSMWAFLDLPDLWAGASSAAAPPRPRTNMPMARRRVGNFLQECCERQAEAETHAFALYASYYKWAHRYGEPPLSPTVFGRVLSAFGLNRRKSRGSVYLGIRLRPMQPPKARRLKA